MGDIPILGHLFTSRSFKEGKSELVFFITPEIVDATKNNQLNLLTQQTAFTNELEFNQEAKETKESQKRRVQETENKELSPEQKLNQFLGY